MTFKPCCILLGSGYSLEGAGGDRPHLGGDDVARHHHDLLGLGARLGRLRDVHVHLVAVKVGVVGRGDRQVQPERRVGQDADPVALQHHTIVAEYASVPRSRRQNSVAAQPQVCISALQ